MTPEEAAALRAPFPSAAIGTLPKPTRKDAPKGTCQVCGGYHGLPAVHLDYVGHAAATDRLLQVDPAWSWEPFALDANGLPALDRQGNLWIRLTICGVTRPGVGDGNSMKEMIGDAIRNAAMRFGVALDLWAKEDLTGTAATDEHVNSAPDDEPAALVNWRRVTDLLATLKALGTDEKEAVKVWADGKSMKPSVLLDDDEWLGRVELFVSELTS